VSGPVDSVPLARAREDLRAAAVLLETGYPSQALSRASTAALRAAEAALLAVDAAPSSAAGIVSAFTRRVVVQGGLDPAHGRALRVLFEDRHDVEHAITDVPHEEALRALRQADAFVEETARWIAAAAAPAEPAPAEAAAEAAG
jgi:uncharacterized protein (UPF0332 family)